MTIHVLTPPVRQHMGRIPTGTWASYCSCRDPASGRQVIVIGGSAEECAEKAEQHRRAMQRGPQTSSAGSLGEGGPAGGDNPTPPGGTS